MKPIIYQKYFRENTVLPFPYPPVFAAEDVEYICFTDRRDVTSRFWKVEYADAWTDEDIQAYLKKMEDDPEQSGEQCPQAPENLRSSGRNRDGRVMELQCNQIIVGSDIITIPSLHDIPEIDFKENEVVPTKDSTGSYRYKRNPVYTDGPYHGRKYLLTLGVPVSNQIGTIERCLSHVKPLLDELDSELLVIDTGSTDGTLDICRAYGARIIEFPWCDNMSAVRNAGIYHSMGEWYLSLDDDEWFEDVTEILEFFKSGLYKKYEYATYIQRNYHTMEGSTWSDTVSLLMAWVVPELHFEGRIHDAITSVTADSRLYHFSSYVHHYGFVKDDEQKMRQKYIRNASLLLQDMWEYPADLRYNYQFAKELNMRMRYDLSEAFFWRGLSIEKELPNAYEGKQHAIYLLTVLCNAGNERLFSITERMERTYIFQFSEKAFLHYIQAELGLACKRDAAEIIDHYKKYRENRSRFEAAPQESLRLSSIGLEVCTNPPYKAEAEAVAFCAYVKLGEEQQAVSCLTGMEYALIRENRKAVIETMFTNGTERLAETFLLWLTPTGCELWRNEFFTEAFEQMNAGEGLPEFFPLFLRNISLHSVMHCLDADISKLQTDALNSVYRFVQTIEAVNSLPLQELYFYSRLLRETWKYMRATESGMDVFVSYVWLTGYFAGRWYRRELLEEENTAVEGEIRAAYEISIALADEVAGGETILRLRRALKAFPAFKEEIGRISRWLTSKT